ncbi:hypothetical protein [Anthocerotibacter panamensis]|uniref:hypothetical protein n=1 Tax=Anthocerotibacter panamensis TaxID=2857077 RepID=UPI001C407FFC|nr:hypothetical protein [Anthocerotibacter panamensis]
MKISPRLLLLGVLTLLRFAPATAQDTKQPVLRILLPEPGAVYGKILPIQVEVENFTLSSDWSIPGQEQKNPVSGAGHLHYMLDNRTIAATATTALILEDLPTAEHTLVVTLANHDHTLLSVSQRVIFNVVAPTKGLTRHPVVGSMAGVVRPPRVIP